MERTLDKRLEPLAALLRVVDRLRAECPWDRKQTLETMVPCVQEEAAEIADAVAASDLEAVREELGDLLMNIFLMSRIAEQDRRFSLLEVAQDIADKLVRRHPHVFGDSKADSPEQALRTWEHAKHSEKSFARKSLLDGVPAEVSALRRATKLVSKAASVGFDWPDVTGALDKVAEELEEARRSLLQGEERFEQELGDLLFAVVCAARLRKVDPEIALRRACDRFERRFRYLEKGLGERMGKASLDEMEALWREAKGKGL